MKHQKHIFSLLSLIGLIVLMGAINTVIAQERQAFSKDEVEKATAEAAKNNAQKQSPAAAALPVSGNLGCTGPISQVIDVAFEGVKTTTANYFALPGGGEGGRFDPTPLLSTKVTLTKGCLNAHLSALVGGKQVYHLGTMTFFQVTLTRINPPGGPRHMVGHYTPFGINSPAVWLESERDVDTYASNFFQKVGTGVHELPPGNYRVDVWWAGGDVAGGPGGAIGAAFVLKLYTR